MAHTYVKLGSINGPVNASGSTVVTGGQAGQPAGFSLDGVFESQYSLSGLSSDASSLFSGGVTAGKVVPDKMQIVLNGSVRDPEVWSAAAKSTVFPRACVIVTANATGGVASEWVRAYYLMQNVIITAYRTITDDGSGVYHDAALSYSALLNAWFATPSGGVLGEKTSAGWDFVSNKAWTGA
jgi:hypothetical protein